MTPTEHATALKACADGLQFAGTVADMAELWPRMQRSEFILWYLQRRRIRHPVLLRQFARETAGRFRSLVKDPIMDACLDVEHDPALYRIATQRLDRLMLPQGVVTFDAILAFSRRDLLTYLWYVATGLAARAAAATIAPGALRAAFVASRDCTLVGAAVHIAAQLRRHGYTEDSAIRLHQLQDWAAAAVVGEQRWQAERLRDLLPNPFADV